MDKIKFDVFIKGKTVNLVSLTLNVVENTNWYNWFNDEETTYGMQQHYFPNNKEKQKIFFNEKIKDNPGTLQLGIVHIKDDILIGMISLSDINTINKTAEFAIIIGEKKYRNFNNFIEASKLIIKHGFESLNLNRIYGGSIIKEIDTMFCKLLGFSHEGVSKEAVYKNGKYVDNYRHAILKKNYKSYE